MESSDPAFIGDDRIVRQDVTGRGLHRLHVMRMGDWPDEAHWQEQIPAAVFERKTRHWWIVGNEYHLYLTWPTPG
jgi:hypothetical protein